MAPRSERWRSGTSAAPAPRRSSRPSRRSWIAAGVRNRTRAAASSMARGTPPRWATIAATSPALASVTANPGRTAPRAGDEQPDGLERQERLGVWRAELGRQPLALERRDPVEVDGRGEARDRVLLLAGDVQRRAARREDAELRRPAQELADVARPRRAPARGCPARAAPASTSSSDRRGRRRASGTGPRRCRSPRRSPARDERRVRHRRRAARTTSRRGTRPRRTPRAGARAASSRSRRGR